MTLDISTTPTKTLLYSSLHKESDCLTLGGVCVHGAHRTAFFITVMVSISFYTYNGHPNTVRKKLSGGVSVQGDLRQTFDVQHPTVVIRIPRRPTFNYCHISSLGRYYFIERVSFEGNNTYRLSLRVDVLKTYEREILAATGRIAESENPDPYISNRETVYKRKPNFEKVPFTETGLLNEDGKIIMVTLKGTTN